MSNRFLSSSQAQQAMRLANRSTSQRNLQGASRSVSPITRIVPATTQPKPAASSLKMPSSSNLKPTAAKISSFTGSDVKQDVQRLREVKTILNSGYQNSIPVDESLELKKAQQDKENMHPAINGSNKGTANKIVPESEEPRPADSPFKEILMPSWTRNPRPAPDPKSRFSKIYQEAKQVADDQLKDVQSRMQQKLRRKLSGEIDSDGDIVPSSTNKIPEIGKTPKRDPLSPQQPVSRVPQTDRPPMDSPFSNRQQPVRPVSPFGLLTGLSSTPAKLAVARDVSPGTGAKVADFGEKGIDQGRTASVGVGQRENKEAVGVSQGDLGNLTPKLPFDVNSFTRTIAVTGSKSPVKSKPSNPSTDRMNEGFLDASKRSDNSSTEFNLASLLQGTTKTRKIEPEKSNPFDEWNKAVKLSQEVRPEGSKMESEISHRLKRDQELESVHALSLSKMRFTNTHQISRQIMNDTPIKSRPVVSQPFTKLGQTHDDLTSNPDFLPTFGQVHETSKLEQTPVFGVNSDDSSKDVFMSFGKGTVIGPTPSFFVPENMTTGNLATPTFGEIQPFTYNTVQNGAETDVQRRVTVTFGAPQTSPPAPISPVRVPSKATREVLSPDKPDDEDSLLALLHQEAADQQQSRDSPRPN